jgi:small-conductance mechanosensitive channel
MDRHNFILNLIDTQTCTGKITAGLFILLAAYVTCFITTYLLENPKGLAGKLKSRIDHTIYRYFIRVKNVLIFIIAVYIYSVFVPGLKNLIAPIMASAGAMAVIGGFAAKSTIANFVAGLLIVFYRPVKIGDKIEFDGQYCTVEGITLRHTIARTLEDTRILIPNSALDEMILVNYSIIDPRVLCTIVFGVSLDTDIDLARRLILEEAEMCPHMDKKADPPVVKVISCENFSIGLRLYLWVSTPDEMRLARFWLFEMIKKRFDREGVEIPFPYRTLVYKRDLPPPPGGKKS